MTAGICNSFKQELLQGLHLAAHTYKIALLTSASTASPTTASYTGIDGEVAAGGGYATGGIALVGFTTGLTGTTGFLDWTTDPYWAGATITARGAIIYNDSLAGKNAVLVIDFGADKSSTNGTFTVQLPAGDATNAIVRLT